jgi:hypothetical protein
MSDDMEFDFAKGMSKGDEGMGMAREAEKNQQWQDEADAVLPSFSPGSLITSDDIVERVGWLPGDGGPNTRNVIGAWFSGKAKRGYLAIQHGMTQQSRRVDRHGGMIRVWKVL